MRFVPIGRFSAMTRLSVKALRLYDEIGLLKPARIDPSSGYRYYELSQANRAEAVRILRSVEMPLEEIRVVLDLEDHQQVHEALLIHKERLAARVAAQERMLAYLETLIKREGGVMPYEVKVEERKRLRIAATKFETSMDRIAADVPRGFMTLFSGVGKGGLAPAGPPLIIFHDKIDGEVSGFIELCVPVNGNLPEGDEVYTRDLPQATVATAIHQGPYEEVSPAYHTIAGWIGEHGHEIVGPPREFYLNDPSMTDPADLLTRVEFPING